MSTSSIQSTQITEIVKSIVALHEKLDFITNKLEKLEYKIQVLEIANEREIGRQIGDGDNVIGINDPSDFDLRHLRKIGDGDVGMVGIGRIDGYGEINCSSDIHSSLTYVPNRFKI